MTQAFIDAYGWRWALRITGIMGGGITIVASAFIRPRFLVPKVKKPIFDAKYFKDYRFTMLYVARLPAAFGFFVPFSWVFRPLAGEQHSDISLAASPNSNPSYLPSFAVNAGMTAQQGSLALGVINGASALGRVSLGYFADRFGNMNSYAICQLLTPVVILCVWPFATQFWSLILFAILLGFFSGELGKVVEDDCRGLDLSKLLFAHRWLHQV